MNPRHRRWLHAGVFVASCAPALALAWGGIRAELGANPSELLKRVGLTPSDLADPDERLEIATDDMEAVALMALRLRQSASLAEFLRVQESEDEKPRKMLYENENSPARRRKKKAGREG